MLLESVNVVTKHVEELLEKINSCTIKTYSLLHIEDHFTGNKVDKMTTEFEGYLLWCQVERFLFSMYCSSEFVVHRMVICLPRSWFDWYVEEECTSCTANYIGASLLTLLKQEQEEWANCCAGFNKVWSEIYSKNYHKSLDHHSFYFNWMIHLAEEMCLTPHNWWKITSCFIYHF